ncbi:hypothetical protein PR048_021500 [Dryococelus australis]|uniref:MADF domain-containing protein n=1 Tax=Dryococelus australis TaxID=614101 RepID=A0ABQ9GYC6_9NEOP|nr:hypothetical protein PR048_021500 [Dryococelus australis]
MYHWLFVLIWLDTSDEKWLTTTESLHKGVQRLLELSGKRGSSFSCLRAHSNVVCEERLKELVAGNVDQLKQICTEVNCKMECSKEGQIKLIETYKQKIMIWDPDNPHLFNKSRKQDAREDIRAELDRDVNECKKKMESLLSALRRERRKTKDIIRTGKEILCGGANLLASWLVAGAAVEQRPTDSGCSGAVQMSVS